jgi:putative NIF3 family GTP cyclohydrolase 1 type 2
VHANASLDDIVAWLDGELDVARYATSEPDSNGLLFRAGAGVSRFAVAVNTSLHTIVGAAKAGAQLLIVHHTAWPSIDLGLYGEKMEMLGQAGVSLYGAHHSLDNAQGFGNGWALAEVLGLTVEAPFGELDGGQPGVVCSHAGTFEDLVRKASDVLRVPIEAHANARTCSRIGIIPGAGVWTSWLEDARRAGADTYVTGEGSMYTRMYAKETGTNLLFGTHYATEAPGIRALGRRLGEHAQIEWEFIAESPEVF